MLKASFGTAAARRVTERKFGVLFLFLLAYLVLFPYARNTGLPYLTFRVFGSVVTVLSIYAVSFRRRIVTSAIVLAIPALVQRIVLPKADAGVLPIVGSVLSLAFDVFIVVTIFRRVFLKDQATKEAIFGALCIYLLAGFSFSNLYAMLAAVQPHAFYLDPTVNVDVVPDRFDFIYYSFANLTCLGAAGITPVSDQARSFSVIEAVLGVLYLAVLISRLLNAYHTSAQVKRDRD
ncbi:MAG TPA: ion channel [Bryobacteraceae bacterium]|jgi:hypothetical protein|nr:ion channel [Bryobacteraceae bacterium]